MASMSAADNIVEIEGFPGHPANNARMDGVAEVLKGYPNIKVVAKDTGKWDEATGQQVMSNFLASFPTLDGDGPVFLAYTGTFENADGTVYSGDFDFYQDMWDPQTVIVRYYVMNDYIPGTPADPTSYFTTTAKLQTADPYIVLSATATNVAIPSKAALLITGKQCRESPRIVNVTAVAYECVA